MRVLGTRLVKNMPVLCLQYCQVRCLSSICGQGYYRDVLSPERTNASIVGDLTVNSAVCVPCDPLCAECTGPGNRLDQDACQECLITSQDTQCVRECNSSTGKNFL